MFMFVFVCDPNSGCSIHSVSGTVSDTGRLLHDNKVCPSGEGLMSYASCCHAPNLECHLKEHESTDLREQVRDGSGVRGGRWGHVVTS